MSVETSPVFVVGCPRSGTTWLYHLLVSSGTFANYRAETHFFDLFLPACGSPRRPGNRRRLAEAWLRSTYHERTGVDPASLRARLLESGTSAGSFLTTIMDATARQQGAPRWAECTPGHALHLSQIAREIPEARFIHLIRDGRDVAISLAPRGWVRSMPWDRGHELLVAAWKWEWVVRNARRASRRLGGRVLEVRYESLLSEPQETLNAIGHHIGATLELSRIRETAVGSVATPNTSFAEDTVTFDPVARWRSMCAPEELAHMESTIGPLLLELGYDLSADLRAPGPGLRARRSAYRAVTATKSFLKYRTPLARIITDPESAAAPRATTHS